MNFINNNIMTNFKNYLLVLPLIVLLSCGGDEDPIPQDPEPEEPEATVISAVNFETSVDENPEEGAVLGTLNASSQQGTVTFALVSQSIPNSLAVNANSGELTVNEVSAFDFEINTSIEAVFSASLNGETVEASIAIAINDLTEPIDLTAYSYVERTGQDNPFDGIDVGSDAYPSLADYDNDGDLDLIVGSLSGTFALYQNDNGVFTPVRESSNPFAGFDVGSDSRHTFADVDADGDLDLVSGSGDGPLYYYENVDGVFSYKATNHILDDVTPVTIDSKPAFVDYDNDGDLDMLMGYFNRIALWENDGEKFTNIGNSIFGASLDQTHQFPTFADLDLDGKQDLIAGRIQGDFRLLMEGEDGNYALATDIEIFTGLDVGTYSSPAFIDLNGDGLLEMISGNGSGTIKYFELTEK